MTKLEEIARLLCVDDGHDPDGPTCDIYVEGDPYAGTPWASYRSKARAVLAALKTPTPAMIEAGAFKIWAGDNETRWSVTKEAEKAMHRDWAAEVYRAMIAAADDGERG